MRRPASSTDRHRPHLRADPQLPAYLLAVVTGWHMANIGATAGVLAAAYEVSLPVIGLIATALLITHAAMQLPAGRIVDRLGSSRAGTAGLVVMIAANGLAVAAPSAGLAVGARALAGVGTALGFVAGSDILRSTKRSALAQGLYGGIGMASAGLAIAVLPQVELDLGWRATWLTAAALAIAALIAMVRHQVPLPAAASMRVEEQPRRRPVVSDRPLYRLAVLYASTYGSSVLIGNWVVTLFARTTSLTTQEAAAAGALTLFGGIVTRPLGGWLFEQRAALIRPAIALSLVAGAVATGSLLLQPGFAPAMAASLVIGLAAGIPFGPVFASAHRQRPDRPGSAIGLINGVANALIVAGLPLVGLTFSLPGKGRIGFLVIAVLWIIGLLGLPSPSPITPDWSAPVSVDT